MRQTGLYLGIQQLKHAKKMAQREGITVSEVVRRALDFYFTLHPEPDKKRSGG